MSEHYEYTRPLFSFWRPMPEDYLPETEIQPLILSEEEKAHQRVMAFLEDKIEKRLLSRDLSFPF